MNLDRMEAVLAGKRELHPELSDALTWEGLLRILERERIRIYQARLPNPAMLVPYHGSWTIIVAKGSDSTKHKQYVAHELAHIWFHVDAGVGRFEHCLNYTYPESADPREQEAEYLSLAILFGPKVFPRTVVPARFREIHAQRFQPTYVKADGLFATKVVGTAQKPRQLALEKICGPKRPEGYDKKTGAILKCEDTNPHDPNAVRVEIRNFHVGYLSRDNAKKFRALFDHRDVRCPAHITGGIDKGGNNVAYFGVRLDITLSR